MATHIADAKPPYDYVVPIHVGKASAGRDLRGISDRAGKNISAQNHIYAELTALYWIWKNTPDEILGLCHYRRFFKISEPEIRALVAAGKVILPPGYRLKWQVDRQFMRVHGERVWTLTLEILRAKYPALSSRAPQIFSGNRLYRHNMFIAGREFVEAYCAFLFDVLFELQPSAGSLQFDDYQQRYGGFVAERLLTLYILANDIPRVERRIVDAAGKDISPGKPQQMLNQLYFRLLGK
jgi:hypothetical protein